MSEEVQLKNMAGFGLTRAKLPLYSLSVWANLPILKFFWAESIWREQYEVLAVSCAWRNHDEHSDNTSTDGKWYVNGRNNKLSERPAGIHVMLISAWFSDFHTFFFGNMVDIIVSIERFIKCVEIVKKTVENVCHSFHCKTLWIIDLDRGYGNLHSWSGPSSSWNSKNNNSQNPGWGTFKFIKSTLHVLKP